MQHQNHKIHNLLLRECSVTTIVVRRYKVLCEVCNTYPHPRSRYQVPGTQVPGVTRAKPNFTRVLNSLAPLPNVCITVVTSIALAGCYELCVYSRVVCIWYKFSISRYIRIYVHNIYIHIFILHPLVYFSIS